MIFPQVTLLGRDVCAIMLLTTPPITRPSWERRPRPRPPDPNDELGADVVAHLLVVRRLRDSEKQLGATKPPGTWVEGRMQRFFFFTHLHGPPHFQNFDLSNFGKNMVMKDPVD